ncbi:MAG TPA: hypothetical protein PK600_04485 [Deltaproteobacteria bacterium]|nr:hypothetical protein [Deltaproteobacteria bacterium]
MKILRVGLLVVLIALCLSIVGCGIGEHEEVVAPIHLEMNTNNVQHEIGVSGFIFGMFLLLNSYVVIIVSCIILLVKESTFAKIIDAIRMLAPMVMPMQEKQEKVNGVLGLLTQGDTRMKVGSLCLLAGVVMAYVGAWIAL